MRRQQLTLAMTLVAAGVCLPAVANAVPQALIMNEANTVSGGKYLGGGRSDPELGRVQGNGQNWWEFLVAGSDPGKNTLDLRGWSVEWNYHKDDNTSYGNGVMTFSQDPLWASVPRGTMIMVTEFQKAWYLTNTPDEDSGNPNGDPIPGFGGMQRDGGINGFGVTTGSKAYNPAIHTLLDFSTDTGWNPASLSGADWRMDIWAGEKTPSNEFKYFNFSGSVWNNGATSTVGVDLAAGLFAINNDDWRFTIKDAQGNVLMGPVGEGVPNSGTGGWGGGGVNSQELVKLESFTAAQNPTINSYLNITPSLYQDGSSSTFGAENQWDNYTSVQDLSPLRDWFNSILPGDANLDGQVSIADFVTLQSNFGNSTDWRGGDFNGDGVATIADFVLLQSNYGSSSAAALPLAATQAVPEPASVLMLTIGGAGAALLTLRRRRSRS